MEPSMSLRRDWPRTGQGRINDGKTEDPTGKIGMERPVIGSNIQKLRGLPRSPYRSSSNRRLLSKCRKANFRTRSASPDSIPLRSS